MEPIVFDLDETLLNRQSINSDYTSTVHHPVLRTQTDHELVRVPDLDGHLGMRAFDES